MYLKVINIVLFVLISNVLCWEYSELHDCDNNTSVDITSGIHLSNGDIDFESVTYKRSEYYVNNKTGQARGCICMKERCLRKCCPLGFGYDFEERTCCKTDKLFDPPIWDNDWYKQLEDKNASELFHFVIGKATCSPPGVRVRIGQATKNFRLRKDGRLYIDLPENIPPFITIGPDEYCMDTFVLKDSSSGTRTERIDALVCFAEIHHEEYHFLSSTCMLISCVFILATVVVYAWLPELQNLHGMVLMAYLICLFVSYILLATLSILLGINSISSNTCAIMTICIYFSLLAQYFWLNVLCFDIWWTFSGKGGHRIQKLSIRARFVAYSLYAFGISTAFTILLVALEFSDLPPSPMLPRIRQQGCYLIGTTKLLYLYGPIIVVCVANLVFFVLTTVNIAQILRQTSVLKSKDSFTHDQNRKDRQMLFLNIKLFVVMGINWILEVLSAIYPDMQLVRRYSHQQVAYRINDAYNILIGVIIFIIFVCKKKIFKLIKRRIKEKFHRSQNDTGKIMDNNNIRMRRWHDSRSQRANEDTTVTSIGTDTTSVETSHL